MSVIAVKKSFNRNEMIALFAKTVVKGHEKNDKSTLSKIKVYCPHKFDMDATESDLEEGLPTGGNATVREIEVKARENYDILKGVSSKSHAISKNKTLSHCNETFFKCVNHTAHSFFEKNTDNFLKDFGFKFKINHKFNACFLHHLLLHESANRS